MLSTILIILLVVVLFLAAALLIRTITFAHPFQLVEPVEGLEVDSAIVAEHLSAAVRCETFAVGEKLTPNRKGLFQLHKLLEKLYPRVHATLQREVVEQYSLLYTWVGTQPDLPGVVLMAHLDVVPADPASLDGWSYPPFAGQIAEGNVWGRGTRDVKNQVICLLEAAEGLLKSGFKPQRTIYLAFGHDEETLVGSGAQRIAALLQERFIEISAVLDEGGFLALGMVPGTSGTVGLIGVAEKGYLTLELSVDSAGGHSSIPPAHTAIGTLAAGLARLEASPMPARLAPVREMMKGIGAAASLTNQLAFANLWLFGGSIRRRLEASPNGNALIRTTSAITIIQGGSRENQLPSRASALVNFRTQPGDSIASICAHVRKVLADERIQFQPAGEGSHEASPFSPAEGPVYESLARVLRQVFGNLPLTPFVLTGSTDAHHFTTLCSQVYRFSPVETSQDELEGIHGVNEHIAIEALGKMVKFYGLLIQEWAS
jgi:carboxypeptidase PM20D1